MVKYQSQIFVALKIVVRSLAVTLDSFNFVYDLHEKVTIAIEPLVIVLLHNVTFKGLAQMSLELKYQSFLIFFL